jgi:hypothetical protein
VSTNKPVEAKSTIAARSAPAPAPAPDDLLAIAVFQPNRTALPRRTVLTIVAWVLILMVVAAAGAYIVANRATAQYGARSEIYYQLTQEQPTGFLRQDRTLSTQLVALTSREVLAPVAAANGMTVDELAKQVHTSVLEDSEVLRVEVDNPSRTKAQALAGGIVTEYLKGARNDNQTQAVTYLRGQIARIDGQEALLRSRLDQLATDTITPAQQQIQSQLDSLQNQRNSLQSQLDSATIDQLNQPRIEQLTQPYVLKDPVSPKPLRAAAAGALAELIVAAAFVAWWLSRRLTRARG